MKYGFIGLGNMTTAIIKGMCKSGDFDPTFIYGYNRTKAKTTKLATSYGIQAASSIEDIMSNCDVIILGVKPQMLPDVLPEVKKHLQDNHVIVSIAAGKNITYFQGNLSEVTPIIRVMPNINALIGASTSCYSVSEQVSDVQLQHVISLFETVGTIIEVPEHLFSIFTTIGGASPAFTYMYIDALARAAVREGMPKSMALDIAANAVLGSAKMILQSQEHPWSLVDQVCSPGGTTIQGVSSLQSNHFETTIHDAVAAVTSKDRNLSK
ncbi:pyrroline-5-carboxylate reductase [Lysinibacillus agricola]|uniref:Pyrroline-5-carboxylate reductase n=1 Tax=Lysinibacillus agricola TaxID=2590012 RepID=A0ABX7AN74_9BACI|nr:MULTISPECIES: pyrroline-5-carboxylate reductase [Lysinibacillus]KOS61900.1 pyrroline-5-carboxylate reductase [Lysinibacillus sp. FJAT-14222]QQP11275.1 pyrroline-5-carboxylate reductase [Lysinibacillus agricola]